MDGQMDGLMDGQMNGQTDGLIEGERDVRINGWILSENVGDIYLHDGFMQWWFQKSVNGCK